MDKKELLKRYWGYSTFKPLQDEIITSVLEGNDTLALLPTGGGKSLCYQLPALLKEGTVLVVSPLIALMKNQVDNIRGFAQKSSLAHFLNSSLSKAELNQVIEDMLSGETKLLYVAPETLKKEETIDLLKQVKISSEKLILIIIIIIKIIIRILPTNIQILKLAQIEKKEISQIVFQIK